MVEKKRGEGILMDDVERKYVQEVRDLLSSVDLKLLELLKTESKELFITEEVIKKEGENIQKEFDGTPIVWTIHNAKKYKNCKYKCGNFVSWNNESKRYVHYGPDFKRLKDGNCPKYPEVKSE